MPPHEPMTLLLIEDSEDDERLALRALRGVEEPLLVRVARDGVGARRLLGLDDESGVPGRRLPEIVVSDLKLPGLHGDELLRLARADARLAGVPYILFSSSREPEDVARCLRYGASVYVQKPVDFNEYVDCLRNVVHWSLAGFPVECAPECVIATPEPCPCVQRGP